MVVVINKFFLAKGFVGFACWPVIFMRDEHLKNDLIFLNHERIHLRQQLELLIIPFFIWYGLEFLFRWLKYKNAYLAYRNISFEREAYDHERSFSYLKTRKMWSFARFL